MVKIQDFKKMEILIGTIKKVQEHPNADRLYVVSVSIGQETKEVVAGIKNSYSKDELIDKKVVFLNNLEPVNIRGVESKGMILAANDLNSEVVSILTVDKDVKDGSSVS